MAPRYHGEYEGMDERREQESLDASMIPSGKGSFANMPEETVMKLYPRVHEYMPEDLDDTIHGVDRQIDLDVSQRRKHFKPKKV
jgi:hypothetical protein